jgi:hypothetical protein
VQSKCATRTVYIDETVRQIHQLANARAGMVRIGQRKGDSGDQREPELSSLSGTFCYYARRTKPGQEAISDAAIRKANPDDPYGQRTRAYCWSDGLVSSRGGSILECGSSRSESIGRQRDAL